MALTRTFLKSMGLTDEQVGAIIENHTETIEGLKKERDGFKAEAAKVEGLTKDLQEANDKLAKSGDAAKVQKEFDDYKAGIEAEKTAAKKRSALDSLLKDKVGIARDSARGLILSAMKLDAYELDDKGQIKDEASVVESLKKEHAEWIATEDTKGVDKTNPPSGGGGSAKMTKEEIAKITDPAKLRAAIAANMELFQ